MSALRNGLSTVRAVLTTPRAPAAGRLPWARSATAGYALIISTFGVMGGWAAVAPLDRAVVASGSVVIEDSRKTVQHLEGGVVAEVLAQEGQHVEKGQLLLRLSPVQAQSSLDIVRSQLDVEEAIEARLVAEQAQATRIDFPADLVARLGGAGQRSALNDQEAQFRERAASLANQRGMLEARIEQSLAESRGLAAESATAARQLGLIDRELVGLRALNARGLASLSRLLTMERERARIKGAMARAEADSARAASAVAEARLQLSQLRQKFQEEASAALTDARKRIAELREKIAVAQDVLTRLEVRSPVAGAVQDVKVATVGQVVRSGEALMDVVPGAGGLVVHAHLAVQDIEHIAVGQRAEIKFPGFHSRKVPLFEGELRSVSRDRLVDPRTQQPYFLAIVSVDPKGVAEPYRSRLVAGMPADILIATGSRTALSYLVAPLTDAIDTGFRN